MNNVDQETKWIPVDTVAGYFYLPFEKVRDEFQQRHLLGEINGILHVTEGQAYLWAQRSVGPTMAAEMFSDLEQFAFAWPEEVPLVEEFDLSTDGDRPYLL